MKTTIFRKTKKTAEGKTYPSYICRLTNKHGEVITADVIFKDCNPPAKFPANIEFNKTDANLNPRSYTNKHGEIRRVFRLWLTDYTPGEPWIDTSLDDFE